MGPFTALNVAAACATCNLMKGARRVGSFVKACRHIATSNGLGDYGSYPERFRNNTSKRSRSSYITASSTHTKTHMLTNEVRRARGRGGGGVGEGGGVGCSPARTLEN
jgi:hypothetical protein